MGSRRSDSWLSTFFRPSVWQVQLIPLPSHILSQWNFQGPPIMEPFAYKAMVWEAYHKGGPHWNHHWLRVFLGGVKSGSLGQKTKARLRGRVFPGVFCLKRRGKSWGNPYKSCKEWDLLIIMTYQTGVFLPSTVCMKDVWSVFPLLTQLQKKQLPQIRRDYK